MYTELTILAILSPNLQELFESKQESRSYRSQSGGAIFSMPRIPKHSASANPHPFRQEIFVSDLGDSVVDPRAKEIERRRVKYFAKGSVEVC